MFFFLNFYAEFLMLIYHLEAKILQVKLKSDII